MPALKAKGGPVKVPSLKDKSSTSGAKPIKGGGKSGKRRGMASVNVKAEIEKVVAQIDRVLKAQISKTHLENVRQHIEFGVTVNGATVRLSKPKLIKDVVHHAAQVPPAKFDPREAGRKVVGELQAAEGGSWTGPELEKLYGLTAANLHKRRAEHRIVFWRDAKNQFHYPKWQFNDAGALLPGVQDVLRTFRSSDEWRVMRYFLGPRHQLNDQTPLNLLRAGKVDTVLVHAKAHGEENSW